MFAMPQKVKTPVQSTQQIKHFGVHCSQFSVSGRLQVNISVVYVRKTMCSSVY